MDSSPNPETVTFMPPDARSDRSPTLSGGNRQLETPSPLSEPRNSEESVRAEPIRRPPQDLPPEEKKFQPEHFVVDDPDPLNEKSNLWLTGMQARLGLGGSSYKGSQDPNKEACGTKRSSIFWYWVLFHFPSISITLALCGVHAGHLNWKPPHPTSEELSALQFAAKAHESLILISLGDILLHRIRYALLSDQGHGISLGFLSSAFYLAAPVQYILSREFWGSVLSGGPAQKRWSHAATVGLILLLVLIGLGANPFSAILMIPRLGWWEVGISAEDGDLLNIAFITKADAKGLFKMEYSSYPNFTQNPALYNSGQADCINLAALALNGSCDKPALEVMLANLLPFISSQTSVLYEEVIPETQNISISGYGEMTLNRPITFFAEAEVAIATAPMGFLASNLIARIPTRSHQRDNYLVRSQPKDSYLGTKWKQPLVTVGCAANNWSPLLDKDSMPFFFEDSFFGSFTVEAEFRKNLGLVNDTAPGNKSEYSKPDPVALDLQGDVPVPISAAFLLVNEVGLTVNPEWSGLFDSQLCLVQARWVDTDIWITDESHPAVLSDIGMPMEDAILYLNETLTTENIIKMHSNWLEGIQGATEAQNGYRQAMDVCLNRTGLGASCMSAFLAISLTDALTYSAPNVLTFYEPDEDEDEYFYGTEDTPGPPPAAGDLIMEYKYYSQVYAYSFEDSTSIPLALAVLLFHFVITLVHIGIILLSSSPWYSSGWGSFGQLMALALRSKESGEFHSGSEGVQGPRIWKKVVTVREDADEKRLEMNVK
ncbi:hypothetical protein ACHAPT_008324 [Fusarium lateritium]